MMIWWVFILVVLYGACVGSFLNVVIYRLPEGRSLVRPGSHCPKCGKPLAWYDNVPVLGWLWLRGKCRYCGLPISVQYPFIEALTAALFGGLYAVYYFSPLRPEFTDPGLADTWPVLVVHLVLVAALLASTVIDARLYIIPLQIPWFATVIALLLYPLAAGFGWTPEPQGLMFETGPQTLGASVGALGGLLLALALLQASLLPRSFAELEQAVDDPAPKDPPDRTRVASRLEGEDQESQVEGPEAWLMHPHPRREVGKEIVFLAFPVLGAVIGAFIAGRLGLTPGYTARVLGGVLCGYFVGAALVWGTRVLGTLGFGKEAMGLGDVHLVAAIGAVLGPIDAVFVFFTAPFFGLAAAVVMAVAGSLLKQRFKAIPYGPYLSGAAVVVMVFRGWFYDRLEPLVDLLWNLLQA